MCCHYKQQKKKYNINFVLETFSLTTNIKYLFALKHCIKFCIIFVNTCRHAHIVQKQKS